MESPLPSKYPNRDGLPLSQLSPERVNGRTAKNNMTSTAPPLSFSSPIRKKHIDEGIAATFFSPGIAQSPSLPEFSVIRERFLPTTDVSGLVKRFEHLDVRDRDAESQERKRKYDEAMDRAKIAREEAEDEAMKYKEELRSHKKEFEECKDRERRACKRIDVLMDEFTRAKEQWSSQSGVYEKEVRRARKEAFKSSSAVLKLQEEYEHVSSELRGTRTKLDLAQRKASQCEEEKFAAQYQLVAVQGELEKLQATLRIAQEEREALKKSLREDDIARVAAEGMIALPTTNDDDTVLGKENITLPDTESLRAKDFERHLQIERRRRRAAQELVQFMSLECRFRCCSCAMHQSRSATASSPSTATSKDSPVKDTAPHLDDTMIRQSPLRSPRDDPRHEEHIESQTAQDVHLTLERFESQTEQDMRLSPEQNDTGMVENTHFTAELSDDRVRDIVTVPEGRDPGFDTLQEDTERACETPIHNTSVRTVTKTIKVPMNFSPIKRVEESPIHPEANTEEAHVLSQTTEDLKAYPFDREAALAAIAYRRGRAKSFAQAQATPWKPSSEDRRDVSAPIIAR